MTWTKLALLIIALWFICGCAMRQWTPDQFQEASTVVTETVATVSTFLPPPWGMVALTASGIVGGILHGIGKIKSYNKGRKEEISRNGASANVPST